MNRQNQRQRPRSWAAISGESKVDFSYLGMGQYLLIPFLGGWTSIYQLFRCSPGVQGFDTLPFYFNENINDLYHVIHIWREYMLHFWMIYQSWSTVNRLKHICKHHLSNYIINMFVYRLLNAIHEVCAFDQRCFNTALPLRCYESRWWDTARTSASYGQFQHVPTIRKKKTFHEDFMSIIYI